MLLLVFAIGAGARLVAGQEEDGTLELELTAPIARGALLAGWLLALWVNVTVLVAIVTLTALALVSAIDMDVAAGNIVAASTALWLLVLGFATLALAVGAATGRRTVALGVAAEFQPRGLALLAAIPVLAGAVGLVRFRGRDLMV